MAISPQSLAKAREAWPGVEISAARLAAYVADRLGDDEATERLHVTDLYLACGLVDGSVPAQRHFEAELSRCVAAAARRVGGDAAFGDELAQRLRERLLVSGGDAAPRIVEYSGRGPLRTWLRVVATREGLMMRRRDQRERSLGDSTMEALQSPDSDPELGFLQRSYRAAFRDAFRAAFAALQPLERDLIRAHHIDGATVDELGRRHQVHRATAARWVGRAREHLLAGTRERLAAALGTTDEELDSILRLIQSRLDITLRSQL